MRESIPAFNIEEVKAEAVDILKGYANCLERDDMQIPVIGDMIGKILLDRDLNSAEVDLLTDVLNGRLESYLEGFKYNMTVDNLDYLSMLADIHGLICFNE